MIEQYPKLILPEINSLNNISVYIKHGGFDSYRKALSLTQEQVIDEIKKSGLRGRGGAAFPTGLKWSFMPKNNDKTKYLIINCDESEPGSFKDRKILEFNPYQLIEGIMIAGYAMGITTAYIYIRGEYQKWIYLMQDAIDNCYEQCFIGQSMKTTFSSDYSLNIHIHSGAGAYICGEETSLMNSIEGKRAYPRYKPPFPAQNGLWGMPTTINNVETIAAVPAILKIGAENYSKIGAIKQPGTLLYGVSGHINRPGVYELPTGTLLKDIIYDVCGGMLNNKQIKAVIPGGSSMPPLRADEIDNVRMDEESLKQYGTHIGTAGIIVINEDTDLLKITKRIAHFYHHESCGQCTPCREGCGWMEKILSRLCNGDGHSKDLDLLISIANNIEGNTVCALGDAAAWAVRGFVTKFRDEFEKQLKQKRTFVAPNVVHSKRNTRNNITYTIS